MKDVHKVAIVAVIALSILLAFYNNAFSQWGYPAPGAQQPGAFPLNPYIGQTFYYQGQNYVYGSTGWQLSYIPVTGVAGTYTVLDNAYNTLDIADDLVIGTDVTQSFWGFRNGGWVLLGGHTATTGTNIEVTTADQGFIYVMMEPESTDTYIADVAKVMAMNSRAVAAQFVDADGDNLNEFLIKWNMANIPAAASGYPSTTFTGYYLSEISESAAITTGADLTAATAAQISYFAPYMTMGTAKTGIAVFKVELKCNTTNSAKATLKSVNVPGKGLILASACSYQLTDTYQIWDYVIGTDLSTALLWEYKANTFDKQDLTFGVQTTLASGDVIVWTLNIYELNYAQTVVIETDDCQMTYA